MRPYTAHIVTDLGFGDAGKGSHVDYLVRKHRVGAVVRYNGGAQATHHVVTPDGRVHGFSHFGSGSFLPGVHTHLSRFMLVDPLHMAHEARQLRALGCGDVFTRTTIDEYAIVVTPFHMAANRLRELLRGTKRHGTCGMGIGEVMADSLRHTDTVYAHDLQDASTLERKLRSIQERKWTEFRRDLDVLRCTCDTREDLRFLSNPSFSGGLASSLVTFALERLKIVPGSYLAQLAERGDLVFEGAQGVLLDEWYGFHPHTTWSTTTSENALTLLREIGYEGSIIRLGLLRAYHTRHGDGPFVSEDLGVALALPELHNNEKNWQGAWRAGWFDFVMARYALAVNGGVDSLVLGHLDRFETLGGRKVCVGYEFPATSLTERELSLLVNPRTIDGKVVASTLRVKDLQVDLIYQETLTGLLKKGIPVYEEAPKGTEVYLRFIEKMLGVRISVVSHGPTALDKREYQ